MKTLKRILLLVFICSLFSCKKDKEYTEASDSLIYSTVNLVDNGDFEDISNNKPINWNLVENSLGNPNNSILIDSLSIDSSLCLKFHHAQNTGCYEMWIEQQIDLLKFNSGDTLLFSFDYKSNFDYQNGFDILLRNSGLDLRMYPSINFISDSVWRHLSHTIVLPNNIGNNDMKFHVHFCIPVEDDWWIDNVKLEKVVWSN